MHRLLVLRRIFIIIIIIIIIIVIFIIVFYLLLLLLFANGSESFCRIRKYSYILKRKVLHGEANKNSFSNVKQEENKIKNKKYGSTRIKPEHFLRSQPLSVVFSVSIFSSLGAARGKRSICSPLILLPVVRCGPSLTMVMPKTNRKCPIPLNYNCLAL